MAYLKPQTPLKDLNSGDYFYPLTTIDQIITGNNRLSAFMSEDNNLLNLKNIGNITGNIILNGTLTVSDNTILNNGLTVSGNTIFDNSVDIKYNNFITFYGKNNNTSPMARMGYMSAISGGIVHCVNASNGYQASGAFYIWSNGCDTGNDNGGIAIDNEGVTVFGAGDAGDNFTGVFRVINEDDIASGPKFLVQKNGHTFIPAHLAVGGYNNTSYSLSTASFICDSWIRTVGSSGWYNESYGGGWYMSDSTYIRNYGSKQIYLDARLGVDAELRLWSNTRQITRDSRSVSWIDGRDGALIRESDASSGYHALACVKTGNGAWCIGEYNTSGWVNYLLFSYTTDANYNARTNNATTIRMRNNGVVESAMWNDYAEHRETDGVDAGYVVSDKGDGTMIKSSQRLQPASKIVSDTYGFVIGGNSKAKTPIAVSGRVLVYPYQNINNYKVGDCLCAAPNGMADIMTREEIIQYPDRIIGIVSEIPNYEIWYGGNGEANGGTPIKVDGRIWVYVR